MQAALTPRLTKYNLPLRQLTRKQIAFLLLSNKEAFYGGAAGGAKTMALIQAAFQYVDCPGYAALLIRDTYQNMIKPEGILMQAHGVLANTDAVWQAEKKTYVFPSGATLTFGYLDGPMDHFNYQGAAFQFVGFDEVVAIREYQYEFLFSRLRRLVANRDIPLRVRSASNPPTREQIDRGSWVKRRFVDPKTRLKDVPYLKARMEDNPYLDVASYEDSLSRLDPVTREQMRNGDWDVHTRGKYMQRKDFVIVDRVPDNVVRWVRGMDMAATEKTEAGKDPDYSCFCKMGRTADDRFIIAHVLRFRLDPAEAEKMVEHYVMADGRNVSQRMEQEGGSSGKTVINMYRRKFLGRDFRGQPTMSKSKLQRSTPFINAVGDGRVMVLADCCESADPNEPYTLDTFLRNQEIFPDGKHDDDTDAPTIAFNDLTEGVVPVVRIIGEKAKSKEELAKEQAQAMGESRVDVPRLSRDDVYRDMLRTRRWR